MPVPIPTSQSRGSASKDLLPFVPEPLQARVIRYDPEEDPGGDGAPMRGFYVLWGLPEGGRCRLCPADRCTLEAVPGTDVATCFRVLRGEESDRLAVAFGVDPEAG